MKRITAVTATLLLFIHYCMAYETVYDFEVEGVRYTIIGENIVEIAGINDEINPERQTPSFDDLPSPYNSIGNEIWAVEIFLPEKGIIPTYMNFPGSVSWNGTNYSVVSVGTNAMSDVNFTHVRFPSSINTIKEWAFEYSGIYHIEGLENVSYVGKGSFAECFMDSLTISDKIGTIPSSCFRGTWIKVLTINGNPIFENNSFINCEIATIICTGFEPKSIDCRKVFEFTSQVLMYPAYAFGACYYTRLKVPLRYYDTYMDAGWNKFDKENIVLMPEPCYHIEIDSPESQYTLCVLNSDDDPDALTVVGVYSNENADIVIPATVELDGELRTICEIGRTAFYDCNLGNISIPRSVKSVGSYAFSHSTIGKIEGTESILNLGEGAFKVATIQSFTYPRSQCYVSSEMFMGSYIKKLILTENIKQIYKTALVNHKIDTLVCLAATPPEIYVDDSFAPLWYDGRSNLYELYVPAVSIDQYRTADYFESYHNIQAIEKSTGVDITKAENIQRFAFDGNVLTLNIDAELYSSTGRLIKHTKGRESIILPPGIYIICYSDSTQKIAIRAD